MNDFLKIKIYVFLTVDSMTVVESLTDRKNIVVNNDIFAVFNRKFVFEINTENVTKCEIIF